MYTQFKIIGNRNHRNNHVGIVQRWDIFVNERIFFSRYRSSSRKRDYDEVACDTDVRDRPSSSKRAKTLCSFEECGMFVSHLEDHIEREHTLKYKGYLCENCNAGFLELDKDLFRRHREREHNVHRREDLEDFLVNIPQGYKSVVTCEHCDHTGFTQSHIDRHVRQSHKGVKSAQSHQPAELLDLNELPKCPYKDCNMRTRYMDLHIEDMHMLKYWGYKCLSFGCNYVCSSIHPELLRSHWEEKHGGHYIDDIQIEASRVHVPEGYYDLSKCDVCEASDFSMDRIAKHKREVHDRKRLNETAPACPVASKQRKANAESLAETLKALSKNVDQQLSKLKKQSATSTSAKQVNTQSVPATTVKEVKKTNTQAKQLRKEYNKFLDRIINDDPSISEHINRASDVWSKSQDQVSPLLGASQDHKASTSGRADVR